jgi:undecaprenyl-diphosphatase
MNGWEATLYGIVQGLTEFLPVSSSAHERIVPALIDRPDPGAAFTAVIQLGTMAAVLLYFRVDLMRIATTWTRSLWTPSLRGEPDARMGWYIGLGTIPIAILGLAFKDFISSSARDLRLIGVTLIALGLVLLAAERIGKRTRDLSQLNLRGGLIIGLAQAAALIPGVSRSGATITAGLFLGFTRQAAARFSFLLSIPSVVLSGLFELRKVGDAGSVGLVPTVLATVVSFVVGYGSIAWFLKFLGAHSTAGFVAYRVALGATVLGLVFGGVIAAT